MTDRQRWQAVLVLLAAAASLLVPVLCVSRFQLIFAVILA